MTTAAKPRRSYLAIDELSPSLDLASCYRPPYDISYRYRVPSHHLILVESGVIETRTPNGPLRAQAGDLLCFRPAKWNEYGTRGPTLIYQAHIQFAPPPRHQFTPSLDEFGLLPVHMPLGAAFGDVRRIFETFCMEISHTGAVHQLRLRTAVHELLTIIAGLLTPREFAATELDDWQRLRMQMESDLKSTLSTREMARRVRLSRPYFSRAFKERFGVSPKHFRTLARLREAVRLLRGTDQPVKAVAYEVGFRDPRLFARLCKLYLGVLPSDVRQDRGNTGKIEPLASVDTPLLKTNTFFLPPKTPSNWIDRYYPKE